MADFMNKAAAGTSRMNPSSMVPGSTGNAPQGGFGTQAAKRAPRRVALPSEMQGAGGGAASGNTALRAQMLARQMNAASQAKGAMPYADRVSSAKNGPTPIQHLPTGNWWENPIGTTPAEPDVSSTMLGPWALSEGPVRAQQSDLPVEQQQMLPEKKSRSLKADDFDLLASVFKALASK